MIPHKIETINKNKSSNDWVTKSKKRYMRVRGMAQMVENLPSKCKVLSSNSSTAKEKSRWIQPEIGSLKGFLNYTNIC
jgi:hypothetical protein